MKLNQIKNLGKELTIKELVNVKGGNVQVSYMCGNGITGTARGLNTPGNIDSTISETCGGSGYQITSVRGTTGGDR